MLFRSGCSSEDDAGHGIDGDIESENDGISGDGDNGIDGDIEPDSDGDDESDMETETACADQSGIPEAVIAARSIEHLRETGILMARCIWTAPESETPAADGDMERDTEVEGGESKPCETYRDCPEGWDCKTRWDGTRYCREYEPCSTDDDCTKKPDGHCVDDNDANMVCAYDECRNDSECTARPYGMCLRNEAYPHSGLVCVYHDCQSDDDCAAGQACFCRIQSPYENSCGDKAKIATCMDSCRSSDECGAGHFCISAGQAYRSSTLASCASSGMEAGGFHCTSEADKCGCCADGERCAFNSNMQYFRCVNCVEDGGDCPE